MSTREETVQDWPQHWKLILAKLLKLLTHCSVTLVTNILFIFSLYTCTHSGHEKCVPGLIFLSNVITRERRKQITQSSFLKPLFQVSAHKIQNFSFYNDVSYVQCAPPTMKKRGADSWERNWVNVVNIVFMYYIYCALFPTKGNCLQTVLLVNVKFSLSLGLVKTYFNC